MFSLFINPPKCLRRLGTFFALSQQTVTSDLEEGFAQVQRQIPYHTSLVHQISTDPRTKQKHRKQNTKSNEVVWCVSNLILLMGALLSTQSTVSFFEKQNDTGVPFSVVIVFIVVLQDSLGVQGTGLEISFGRSVGTLVWNSSGPPILGAYKNIGSVLKMYLLCFLPSEYHHSKQVGNVICAGISFILRSGSKGRVDREKVIPWNSCLG